MDHFPVVLLQSESPLIEQSCREVPAFLLATLLLRAHRRSAGRVVPHLTPPVDNLTTPRALGRVLRRDPTRIGCWPSSESHPLTSLPHYRLGRAAICKFRANREEFAPTASVIQAPGILL